MLSRVRKCLDFFELLVHTYTVSPRVCKSLLAKASRSQLLCIAEVVLNTVDQNLEVSATTRRALMKSKRVLRKLARIARLGVTSIAAPSSGDTAPALVQEVKASNTDSVTADSADSTDSVEEGSSTGSTTNKANKGKTTISTDRLANLKLACMTHYMTVIEFLRHCLPYLRRLAGETSENDSSDEI